MESFFKQGRQPDKLGGMQWAGQLGLPPSQRTRGSHERWKLSGRGSRAVVIVGLQSDGVQANSGLVQSCRAVACRELCNNHRHVAPDRGKVASSCIGGHGGAKMCQEFRVVVELNRPKEGPMFSSRRDTEGTCLDVVPVAPNCKFQQVDQTVSRRDTRKDCVERVLDVRLTKGDADLVVIVEGIEEQGGVLAHFWSKSKETSGSDVP